MLISCGLPVSGAWATPRSLARFAIRAEELGYHGLWSFQRLLVGDGQEMAPVYRSVLDPMVALSYAAARTERIRLGVAVINLPYVSPALLAKQAATLDEIASFEGDLYTVPPSTMAPRPVQAGGPPVLLGGTADVALRRAGRIAAGWVSSSRASLGDIQRGVQIVRRAAEESGRDPDLVRTVVRGVVQAGRRDDAMPLSGSWEQIRGGADLYAEAGVTELFYDLNWDPLIGGPDAAPEAAGERAEEIITALAPDAIGQLSAT
jgi:alkanesulfonate monooxygenase SsuD/methylene tetrahydromethanopterin reductase-like flavin-dependent oxidoreductase (luciferase family)